MANPEHLKILKQGVKVWNKWCEENPDIEPDLRRAELCKGEHIFLNRDGRPLRANSINAQVLPDLEED